MVTLLSDEELTSQLRALPEWRGDTTKITRSYTAPSFLAGIRTVDAVADVAEAADHHPDIDIRWRTLTFRLSTHSAGGLTEKDFALAEQIDAVLDSM